MFPCGDYILKVDDLGSLFLTDISEISMFNSGALNLDV